MNCLCLMCQSEGPEIVGRLCVECDTEFYPESDEDTCEDCSCLCEESENGVCNTCGSEVDWVSRTFKETEKD